MRGSSKRTRGLARCSYLNLRFTRHHSPITLRPDFPLLQVQPLLASQYADAVLNATELVPGMEGLEEADWRGVPPDDRRSQRRSKPPLRRLCKTKARRRRKTTDGEGCPARVRPAG